MRGWSGGIVLALGVTVSVHAQTSQIVGKWFNEEKNSVIEFMPDGNFELVLVVRTGGSGFKVYSGC